MKFLAIEAGLKAYLAAFARHSFQCYVCRVYYFRDPDGSENLAEAIAKHGTDDLASLCHDCWFAVGGPQVGKEHMN